MSWLKPRPTKILELSHRLSFGGLRPQDALIQCSDRTQALINELLDTLAAIGFRSENVSLGIGGDAVHCVELARLASAVAEAGQDFEGVAVQDVDFFVGTVA